MASLRIHNVHKRYGNHHILKGIDLAIEDGEFLILVGPSGCGKSTLLSMIAGLDDISEGQIQIDERVVNEVSPKDRDIAMVFQSYALYPSMTVRENMEFGLRMKKVPPAERAQTIERVARMLQIEALLERRPAQLSGGQRQRVAMGRALARNPAVFLFDEPLSNLDAKLRVEMRAEIKALHQRLKSTIVYVTHDQVEAMTLGDKIAVMKEGQVQQFASPKDIYERPANMYVAGFMGSPSMNFVSAQLRQDGACSVVRFSGCAQDVVLPHAVVREGAVVVGVRPEHWHVLPDGAPQALRAQVLMLEPTGADTYATLQLGDQRVNMRFAAAQAPALGREIALRLDAQVLSLFDPQSQQRLN
jgi:multiple sugar transport system ATP-binding protein